MADYLKSDDEKESGVSDFLQFSKQKAVVCSNCGKKIQTLANIKIAKCPFCKTDLPSSN